MLQELSEGYYEEKNHVSKSFPFNIYPCSIPLDFNFVALHWQDTMELIYVKKGKGLIQIGIEVFEANENDIFIIPPKILHALRSITHYSMEYENFFFDLRFLGLHTADTCSQNYLIPLSLGQIHFPTRIQKDNQYYIKLADCLIQTENLCKDKNNGYELGVKSYMMLFIYYLFQLTNDTPHKKESNRLTQVLALVEHNFEKPLTIKQVSTLCGYSTSHFMRWFKQMTGSSFTTYLNERRLVAATEKLNQTNDTILSICESVGFENLSNFNRQFKKRYGLSPREYRNSRNK